MRPLLPAILSCSGTELTDEEKLFFANVNPLGVNLFGRNISSPHQLTNLIKEIKETIARDDVLIAVDQEGGRVQRLKEPNYIPYAAAATIGALPPVLAARAATLHAELIAHDLQTLGINLNYAPVLDLAYPQTTNALKSRCFSDNANLVAALGRCEVDKYLQNGIIPCIKHLPGHGRAQTDPHLGLPRIDATLEELANDFYPFQQLNDCPLAMTAHIVISAIDNSAPVTQSAQAIQTLIRQIIGFDGLLISDAIDMHALQGTAGEKAAKALNSGCDVICYALGNMAEMQDIAANLSPMSDKSLERFANAAKIIHNTPQEQPWQELKTAYKELIGTIAPYQETYDATEVLNRLLQTK